MHIDQPGAIHQGRSGWGRLLLVNKSSSLIGGRPGLGLSFRCFIPDRSPSLDLAGAPDLTLTILCTVSMEWVGWGESATTLLTCDIQNVRLTSSFLRGSFPHIAKK